MKCRHGYQPFETGRNWKSFFALRLRVFVSWCFLVASRGVCVWEWVGALVGSIGVINLFVRVSVCESARVRIFPSIILRPLLSTNISILVKMDDFSWSASCQLDNDSHPPSFLYPPFQFAFHLCCFKQVSLPCKLSRRTVSYPRHRIFLFSLVYSLKYGYFVDSPLLHNKQAGKLSCLWKFSWLLFAGVFVVCSSSY